MNIYATLDPGLVARLTQDAQEYHAAILPDFFKPFDYEAVKGFFELIIRRPKHQFLVMEDGEKPVGFAWIEFRSYADNPFRRAYRSVYVHQISINRDDRGRGYGTRLMERIAVMAGE